MNKNIKFIYALLVIAIIGGGITLGVLGEIGREEIYMTQNAPYNIKKNLYLDVKVGSPEEVVQNFYNWYLKDVYSTGYLLNPNIILIKDVYQIESSEYFKFLNKTDYFSQLFYNNELEKFKKCNEKLKNVKRSDVEETGDIASEHVEGNECGFFNYYVWVGGQGEDLNTVHILDSEINEGKAEVLAVVGYVSNNQDYEYSYPRVELIKENNLWKISRIGVSFDYPKWKNIK